MSDVLLVDFGAMQRAGDDIQAALNTLHTELAQLESDAAGLVATWDGTAREAYQNRQERWRRAAQDLSTMLGEIKRALDDSMADYMAAEQKNTNLFH